MKALVLGGAVSGKAAVGLLDRLDADIVVYDQRPEAVEAFAAGGRTVASGDWDPALLDGVDVVVASPGFPPHAAAIVDADAAEIPVWNEVELALQQMSCPIVAVTGTNGKTTVVELTAAMLERSGRKVIAAGNIGTAISDIAMDDWDVVVLEVSSFQLERTESLRPAAAVILNVAPDHLDWHGTYEAYAAAKGRIYRHLDAADPLVFDMDDPGAVDLAEGAPGRHVRVSGLHAPDDGFGVRGDVLAVPGQEIPLTEISVSDRAYRMDLAAAAVAAHHVGATDDAIRAVVTSFEPSEHRRSVVGAWDGVTWVNDSKATNPHSALAAIATYPSVVLIAGGRNKGLDLAPLATADNVRHLIAIGESADELLAAADRPATQSDTLGEAVRIAGEVAVPGDTVLLSPGCASFDMFDSYQDRGRSFTRLVREAREHAGGGVA